jgi:hypothetical protein
MPTAVQPVPPEFGPEELSAIRAEPPWAVVAPPPSSFVPMGQVAVDWLVVVPATAPLLAGVVVPVTTVLVATVPAGP